MFFIPELSHVLFFLLHSFNDHRDRDDMIHSCFCEWTPALSNGTGLQVIHKFIQFPLFTVSIVYLSKVLIIW